MYEGRICVPKNEQLRKEILDEAHNTPRFEDSLFVNEYEKIYLLKVV